MKKVMLKTGDIEKRVIQESKKGEFVIVKNKRVYITKKAVRSTHECSEYVENGIDLDFLHNRYIDHMEKNGGFNGCSDSLKKSFTEVKE